MSNVSHQIHANADSVLRCRLLGGLLALSLFGCGGGGGGGSGSVEPPPLTLPPAVGPGNPPPIGAQVYSISGSIVPFEGAAVDGDVNDPNAPYASNDSLSSPQPLGGQSLVGGFASARGTGHAGDRFAATADKRDVYAVDVAAGQTISLAVQAYEVANPKAVDLDLQLFRSDGVTLVAASAGTGAHEALTVEEGGAYRVVVEAIAGASNYTLTIGAALSSTSVDDLKTTAEFVPGDVIVRFKDSGTTARALNDSLEQRAAAVGLVSKAGVLGRASLLSIGTGANRTSALAKFRSTPRSLAFSADTVLDPALQEKLDTIAVVKALRARDDVISADLNYVVQAFKVANDPLFLRQWHYGLINLPQAWDVTTGSSSAVVAVIDTGVFMQHPDLVANLTDTGFDFIKDPSRSVDGGGIDSDPDDPGDRGVDSSFHGTHVAGTIAAASMNGTGVAGVSWSTRIMPLRVLGMGGGSSYDIAQAIRYAAGLPNDSGRVPAKKADIINLSLGGGGASKFDEDTYAAARQAGVIVIAAAGNRNSSVPQYPASYPGVGSVSAVGPDKRRAPYSSFGSTVDVAAPGGDMSRDTNRDGQPDGVLSTWVNNTSGLRQPTYDFMQGTSMAAPHVAGVAALMVAVKKSEGSTLTPDEFDSLLASGVLTQDLGTPGRDEDFGYGLIDALKAVSAVKSAIPTALFVSEPAVSFDAPSGNTASHDVTVQKVGNGKLAVIGTTSNSAWLTIAPRVVDTAGIGQYTIHVSNSGLSDGTYAGVVTFDIDNGTKLRVDVTMKLRGGAAQVGGNVGR